MDRISQENIDSELCNIEYNTDDSNIPTVCILHASVGITDEEPKPPPSSKKMKKYGIPNRLLDEKLEKKRQDAIKSKQNRDKVKHNQKVTENELAKYKDMNKNLEKEFLLREARHGKEIAELKMEIAELKMEIAQGKTEIVLRDKTISDLQHQVEFNEFLLNLGKNQ